MGAGTAEGPPEDSGAPPPSPMGCLLGNNTYFLDFGCGECSWLLHLQMVRPKCLDS